MTKDNEKAYIDRIIETENIPPGRFENFLLKLPFSDKLTKRHLMDIAQIIYFFPHKYRELYRVLELGYGSGWASEFFAKCGYNVIGVDIAERMIEIARDRECSELDLSYYVFDYEKSFPKSFGFFNAAVFMDSLHHADSEFKALKSVYKVLRDKGICIMLEPGKGHTESPETIEAVKRWGRNEKDMPFDHVKKILQKIGFKNINQYLRLGMLQLNDLSKPMEQEEICKKIVDNTVNHGFTSLIVAQK